ncbi:MAG TPA: hypothetical protein VG826_10040 [Pirellulales bacterium]|nr:hypothetical protein [Pirellulales bacterium]
MKPLVREAGFAFLAWFAPFAVSVCIFPLKEVHRPLFEEVMSLTLTANTALLGVIYLRSKSGDHLMRAVRIGATWTVANWLLDLIMFGWGPIQMPIRQYLWDIAGAYLVIPIITIALAAAQTIRASSEPS